MSFSFSIRAASKAIAKADVTLNMAKIAHAQSCHKRDELQVVGAVHTAIDLLDDDAARDVVVSANGSLSGIWDGMDLTGVTGSNLTISASLADRPEA